jgi:hypothetical protein
MARADVSQRAVEGRPVEAAVLSPQNRGWGEATCKVGRERGCSSVEVTAWPCITEIWRRFADINRRRSDQVASALH